MTTAGCHPERSEGSRGAYTNNGTLLAPQGDRFAVKLRIENLLYYTTACLIKKYCYNDNNMRQTLSFFWEVIKIVLLALLIVLPIRYFVFQPFIVKGISMESNFHNNDYLIVDEFSKHFGDLKRGDVIVFHYPENPSQRFIKRVIGLPEEKVILDENKIEITNKFGETKILDESSYLPEHYFEGNMQVTLKDNQYFVLGDNRLHSYDSRRWGILPAKNIIGRVVLRLWPPTAMAFFFAPSY